MYSHCIYCSADLGRNESLEAFPVAGRVAFDAAQGRLWAICPKCGRWNLAPLEERWEPVEQAERLFREARLRAQSENIGLARLPDGTRLIRVGEALQGELAAWRYGDQLVRRRRQYLLMTGAAVVGGIAVLGGLAAASASGVIFAQMGNFGTIIQQVQGRRAFHHLAGDRSGTGKPITLRRWHLKAARLLPDQGELALEIPHPTQKRLPVTGLGKPKPDPDPLVLRGLEARTTLARGSVHLNASGANRKRLGGALELLTSAGGAEEYLQGLTRQPLRLTRDHQKGGPKALDAPERLALEMALHEEQERRALQGELSVLEAAWRQAEEIAAIADRLALDPTAA